MIVVSVGTGAGVAAVGAGVGVPVAPLAVVVPTVGFGEVVAAGLLLVLPGAVVPPVVVAGLVDAAAGGAPAEVPDGAGAGEVVLGGAVFAAGGLGGVVLGGVVLDGVGRGALAAGGRTRGGCPEPNAQPSTLPAGGAKLPAPSVEYVHEPPGRACQYDQYADAGAPLHGSGARSTVHTNPG